VTRQALLESARRVAGTVEFHNAATVEFLVDHEQRHYFLEMNTRLQVEHGVTELVTGLDLVAWQIRVAAGERLAASILEAPRRGHAIEVRVYAEDPYHDFRPSSGGVTVWRMPEGPGVRVDAGMEADTDLRPEYDPLLAKVMVLADDRPAAVARLRRALDEALVGGLQTDAGFLRWLVDDDAFAGGDYDTGFIEDRWRNGPPLIAEERSMAAAVAVAARQAAPTPAATGVAPVRSAWAAAARREALRE
jgi:acetyl/propionyl-CoA carboxylase alpha subunit